MKYAIEVSHLAKRFGIRKALDDISFQLPEGAFLSIFGPNGAGKTTLLKVLSTLATPSDGKVLLLGSDISEEPEQVRGRIGMLSHEPMVYPDLTAKENLLLFARLYEVEDPERRVDELLSLVELKHRQLDVVRGFSRGMTQRLAIARALINDPQILFLDEPYSGLDPHAISIFDELLSRVREGRTFVMVSHDMEKGLQMCSHSLVIAKGRVESFQNREDIDFGSFKDRYLEVVGMGVS